jgi:AcrR family transcriptional regulator
MRTRILKTAETLYLSGGSKALSMRNVARELGVTATALYRHYRNKDELLDALAERGYAVFARHLRRPVRGPDRFLGVTGHYLDFALQHPRLYELIFLEPRREVRRFPNDFAAHASESFDVLHGIVRDEIQPSRPALENSLEIALTIWAHLHGLVMLYRAGRFGSGKAGFRSICLRSMDRLRRGLLAEQPA